MTQKRNNGCCSCLFLKYVLFIFNFLFWISGIVLLAIGIWLVQEKHHYIDLMESGTFPVSTYLLLASGGLIIIVGMIGCCGAAKDIRFLLLLYTLFLLLIFLLEALAGVLAYMYEGAIHEEIKRTLNKTMLENYYFSIEKTKAIDDMQTTFQCCGAGSYQDWRYSRWLHEDTITVNKAPDSCCKSPSYQCASRDHPSNIYHKGCAKKLEDFFRENLFIIGSIGLGLCCLQILGILLACCLMQRIKKTKPRSYL